MSGNGTIQLDNVSRVFGTQQVLANVTLGVRSGETRVIVGESGCGKSVTLKLMMALMDARTGLTLVSNNSQN